EALASRSLRKDAALLARTGVARALGGRAVTTRVARPWIVSARVDNVTTTEALELIFAPPQQARGRFVAFAHPHALNLARRDAALRQRLADADVVLPDGNGLRVAGRMLGSPLVANVNGTDLLPLLCREAAK